MRHTIVCASFAFLLGIALVGCGSTKTTSLTGSNPTADSVPVSFSISDTPPTGVTILRFQIQVTGATLAPGSVPLLSAPVEVELEHLQTEPALLANLNVPMGTYTSLTANFANPQMTILNQTGATLPLGGGQNCAVNQVCTFTPALSPTSATVMTPTPPFPITLAANSPLGFVLHFDVNASVQSNLSVSPTVSLYELPAGAFEHFHVIGVVTGVSSPDFTLQVGIGGSPLTIATDPNTVYDFGRSCAAENFTCITDGQVLRVKIDVQPGGALTAERVRLLEPHGKPSLEGLVIGVNTAQNQFQVVLLDMEQQIPNISCGLEVEVQPAAGAAFNIDSDGLTVPGVLSFASIEDILVGQVIEFQPVLPLTANPSAQPAPFTISANSLTLEDSELTATVETVNGTASPPNFEINMLYPLFTNAGITQIEVEPVTGTTFQNVSGVGGLSAGNVVSVGGLLFNTPSNPGGPTLIPEQVLLRQ